VRKLLTLFFQLLTWVIARDFFCKRLDVASYSQATHHGDISRAVEAGTLGPDDVTELGRILLGEAKGRTADDEITLFDSTGLAVQDLAVAALVFERYRAEPGAAAFAGVVEVDLD
jgi:ornithine cyclodeaminase/alanine dehydrogenase-like protein (mu-crystallin family)